jgi:hypothetical protein
VQANLSVWPNGVPIYPPGSAIVSVSYQYSSDPDEAVSGAVKMMHLWRFENACV